MKKRKNMYYSSIAIIVICVLIYGYIQEPAVGKDFKDDLVGENIGDDSQKEEYQDIYNRPENSDSKSNEDINKQLVNDEKDKNHDQNYGKIEVGQPNQEEDIQPTGGAGGAIAGVNTANPNFSCFDNTLFIGDSRTEGFKLYSGITNADFFCAKSMTIDKINQGNKVSVLGGSYSIHQVLVQKSYDKIFLGQGMNELGWTNIEDFLNQYGTLIDVIKKEQPNAKIYLQAVLPVTAKRSSTDKVHNLNQIAWYNARIAELSVNKGVNYLDGSQPISNSEGYLLAEATTDGIHLKSKYCRILAVYMSEILNGQA